MRRPTIWEMVVVLSCFVSVVGGAGRGLAESAASTSFRMTGQTLDLSSGTSTSTHYVLRGCLGAGPEAAGSASSSSYHVQIGCPQALSAGLPADDDDGDGIASGTENNAPNNGDGNGDGIADSTQGNVASVAGDGTGYITVEVPPDQGGCSQLLNVQAINPATLGSDPGFFYPFGMVGFKLNCDGPVQVTVIFHAGTRIAPPAVYRKFGHMAPNFAGPSQFYTLPGVTFVTRPVGTTSEVALHAIFTLTNGAIGDNTDASDHMIVDPGGPASRLPTGPTGAPVLTPHVLAMLAVLLGLVGAIGLRRSLVG